MSSKQEASKSGAAGRDLSGVKFFECCERALL